MEQLQHRVQQVPGLMLMQHQAVTVLLHFVAAVIHVQMVLNLIVQVYQVVQHVTVLLIVLNAEVLTIYQAAGVQAVRVMLVVTEQALGVVILITLKAAAVV